MMEKLVGILAYQGDVAEHEAVLDMLKQKHRQVRTTDDLSGVTHLIIPGGESTVIGRFLGMWGLGKEIQKRVKAGTLAVFGTCAGAILVSRKIAGKNNPSPLGLIDIAVDRNAYGTQIDSFEAEIDVRGIGKHVPVAFIRAPKLTKVGKGVDVLAKRGDDPVLIRQGRVLASVCHPEARGETAIHRLFLGL
jgi:pyridoxal 5'-phosphate synthase pdxT subunit